MAPQALKAIKNALYKPFLERIVRHGKHIENSTPLEKCRFITPFPSKQEAANLAHNEKKRKKQSAVHGYYRMTLSRFMPKVAKHTLLSKKS